MGLQSLGALFMLVIRWPFYIYITGLGPVQPGWVLPDAVGSSDVAQRETLLEGPCIAAVSL